MNFAKLIISFLLLAWIPGLPAVALADGLATLIDHALRDNPELIVARERWQQFSHKVDQVSLDDPQLALTFSNYPYDTFNRGDSNMTGDEVRLSQKFPFPGKLATRAAMADDEAAWYRQIYLDSRLQIVRRVEEAWYRLYLLDRTIEVTGRNLALLDDVVRLAEVRYETGQALQQDVLKAQLQRSRLTERLLSLEQQRSSAEAELNGLTGRPATVAIATPDNVDFEIDLDLSLDDLQQMALHQRPLAAGYQALLDRARGLQKLARLDDYPDLTLWAGWRFRDGGVPDDGTDFVSTGLSINLPLQRQRRAAAVAESSAVLRTVQGQFVDFRRRLEVNLHTAHRRMEESRQQMALYRDGIIPQSRLNFQAALSAYQVGRIEFLGLLDTLRALYDDEVGYYRAESAWLTALARLRAEAGLGATELSD
ncbi:MAG: TolC family protein [Desulfuromonadales bacterium]|nr:TolC family protein [Desulfuromonadales bacterium]